MNEEGVLKQSLDESFKCPLCQNMVSSPKWIPLCGHFFCEYCIDSSLVKANECPTCSVPAGPTDVKPFLQLRDLLSSFTHINRRHNEHNEQEGIVVVAHTYEHKSGLTSDRMLEGDGNIEKYRGDIDSVVIAAAGGDDDDDKDKNDDDDKDKNGEEKVSMSVQEDFTSDVVDHDDNVDDVELFNNFYDSDQNRNNNDNKGEDEDATIEVVPPYQSKIGMLPSRQPLGEGVTVLPDTYQDRFVPDHCVGLFLTVPVVDSRGLTTTESSQPINAVKETTNTSIRPQADSFQVPAPSMVDMTLSKKISGEEAQMEDSLNAQSVFLNPDDNESVTKNVVLAVERRQEDIEEETPDLIQNQVVQLSERIIDLVENNPDDDAVGEQADSTSFFGDLSESYDSKSGDMNENDDINTTRNANLEAKDDHDTAPSTMGGSTMGLLADSGDSDLNHGGIGTTEKTNSTSRYRGSQSPSTQSGDKQFYKSSPNSFQLSGSEGEVARNLKRTISQLKKDLNRLAKEKEGKRHKGSRGDRMSGLHTRAVDQHNSRDTYTGKKSSDKATVLKEHLRKDSRDSSSVEKVVDNSNALQAEVESSSWVPAVMMSFVDAKTLHIVHNCYKKGWITLTSSDPKGGVILVMDLSQQSGVPLAKRVVPRTKNYLMSVAAGCLVVDSRWLQDSLDAGRLLPLTVKVTPSSIPGGVCTISKWESSALAYIIEGSDQDFARHLSLGGPLRSVVDYTRKVSPSSGRSCLLQGIQVHLSFPRDAVTEDVKADEGFSDDEGGIIYPVQRQRVLHITMRAGITSSIDKNGDMNGNVSTDTKILEGELRYLLWTLGATHWNGSSTHTSIAEKGGKENSNVRVDNRRSLQTQFDGDFLENSRIHLWCSLDDMNAPMEGGENVVPLVSLRWLFDCVSTHTRLPVDSYLLHSSL